MTTKKKTIVIPVAKGDLVAMRDILDRAGTKYADWKLSDEKTRKFSGWCLCINPKNTEPPYVQFIFNTRGTVTECKFVDAAGEEY